MLFRIGFIKTYESTGVAFAEFGRGDHQRMKHTDLVIRNVILPGSTGIYVVLDLVDNGASDDPSILLQDKQIIPFQ